MAEVVWSILKTVLLLYLAVCVLVYFFQEKLIFFPEKLNPDFTFRFPAPFEEIRLKTPDNTQLHTLLFKAEKPQGVILYLHGNAGSLRSWGEVAPIYTSLGYDVLILDYRGYGKSEGKITSQTQFYQDVQTAYDALKTKYPESDIVILGYSIGTGPAAHLASVNQPRLLILQAPYYSLGDLMRKYFPVIPAFLLKYRFETHRYLRNCPVPVVLFHGEQDEIIPYASSLKLKEVLKETDLLFTLKGQSHNGMSSNPAYLEALRRVLR
ncbi:alpha/beta hydrolase [Rufibacter glacialis]|uniref:Alpha/beta hydrolase n=1 Tax=Rufibacter glacialis TaxID=1259555 RepID=A0A5M8QHN2_9BACT|nr:alpha/beta fold hydrolase [Rufibacter glacialis]KAA6435539.1 lysophospholipase [Rufibacter glacialis]GGK64423.1 alpha/beta hydrolase [Rufibacter glacialis]